MQLNTRRGDWVARWTPDSFLLGLHRNRASKLVADRVVLAIGASPCEIAAGEEVKLSVSAGAAEYRFGAGKAGILGDAERALQQARLLSGEQGGSHVCHSHEPAAGAPVSRAAAA
jgi:GGDEF domain-containing protein